MKNFTIYLLGLIFFVIGILFIMDIFYTKVYENSIPRIKFQYLRSFKNKRIDYIFLGSSRVENSIVPNLIKEKTGKDVINLGFQASKLSDIYTVLRLVKEYNIKVDKVLIQIDYIFNIEEGYSNVFQYEIMPFIRENQVTYQYFDSHFSDRKEIFYFPFYRYCTFRSKIGFREIFANLINKRSKIIENYGFVSLYGNSFNHDNSLPEEINLKNIYFDKIKEFSTRNNIPIVFFCAPFCKHTKNLHFIKKLKQKIPDLYDFSMAIQNDEMFKNCSHLNNEGACFFTEYLADEILK